VDRLKTRLASRNENKARELGRLLPGWEIGLLGVDDFPPEEGETYYDNARAKALFGRAVAEPEAWALGEDSGIEVDGLGGGPGVESARSGGEDPVGWLLERLSGVEGEGRRARYVCELVGVSPEREELRGTGTLEGRIAAEPHGSEGFGFDPIFIPHGLQKTVAELGDEWKAEHSHRAKAARALLAALSAPAPNR
jgi:XTP/dITP diphosphohydrolase